MHEARDRFDLAQKPLAADRGGHVRLHDLDGDVPAMAGIAGKVDDRHAAFAEQTQDGIRSDLPEGAGRHVVIVRRRVSIELPSVVTLR